MSKRRYRLTNTGGSNKLSWGEAEKAMKGEVVRQKAAEFFHLGVHGFKIPQSLSDFYWGRPG